MWLIVLHIKDIACVILLQYFILSIIFSIYHTYNQISSACLFLQKFYLMLQVHCNIKLILIIVINYWVTVAGRLFKLIMKFERL